MQSRGLRVCLMRPTSYIARSQPTQRLPPFFAQIFGVHWAFGGIQVENPNSQLGFSGGSS